MVEKTATVPASAERYRAPALDKGLDILELLARQPAGMTRAEIVRAMGRSQSEIYRMLERLVARDYVFRSAAGDRYALTMKLFMLGSQHPPVRRLTARALPLMDEFTRVAMQSVHLVVPDRGQALVVAQASTPANWEFRVRLGAQLDLLSTGSGETLLAFQGDQGRAGLLNTWGKGYDPRRLEALEPAFRKVRAAGYRVGDSRQLVGVKDISVPVFGPANDALAVLTCPYIVRLEGEKGHTLEQVCTELKALGDTLSLS